MSEHIPDYPGGCPHDCCESDCQEPGCDAREGTCCQHCSAWHLREAEEVTPR